MRDELCQRQRQGGTGTAEDDQQRQVMKVMSRDAKKVRHAGRGHLVIFGGENSQFLHRSGVMKVPKSRISGDVSGIWICLKKGRHTLNIQRII